MLHEIGHCFDLDHNSEGIMRRGGDDLNLVLAFPPPGSSSLPEKVESVNWVDFLGSKWIFLQKVINPSIQ